MACPSTACVVLLSCAVLAACRGSVAWQCSVVRLSRPLLLPHPSLDQSIGRQRLLLSLSASRRGWVAAAGCMGNLLSPSVQFGRNLRVTRVTSTDLRRPPHLGRPRLVSLGRQQWSTAQQLLQRGSDWGRAEQRSHATLTLLYRSNLRSHCQLVITTWQHANPPNGPSRGCFQLSTHRGPTS